MIVKNGKIRVRAECFGMVPEEMKMTKDLIIHGKKGKAVIVDEARKKKGGKYKR